MTTINFPSNTEEIINAIRNKIGRSITFHQVVSTSGCSASGCSLDPVTGTSTNSFCSVCNGEYWIDVTEDSSITAHVRWGAADDKIGYSAGSIYEGDCRAQIEYSETNATIVDQSETVTVDDKLMSVDKIFLRGVPTINRMILILNEEETDG